MARLLGHGISILVASRPEGRFGDGSKFSSILGVWWLVGSQKHGHFDDLIL